MYRCTTTISRPTIMWVMDWSSGSPQPNTMRLWQCQRFELTWNNFFVLHNYQKKSSAKPIPVAQKHKNVASQYSVWVRCSSAPVFWLRSDFSKARYVTGCGVKQKSRAFFLQHADWQVPSSLCKHCGAWMNAALPPAIVYSLGGTQAEIRFFRFLDKQIPFYVNAFSWHAARILLRLYTVHTAD